MDHPQLLTIPSSDAAFRRQVEHLRDQGSGRTPDELETRLRRLFPRAVVRARDISGEPPAWYVYRDGGWRADMLGEWWEAPGLPRVVVTRDGWFSDANPTALDLLGIARAELRERHLTDFVAPGGMADSVSLFQFVDQGHDLTATVLLRPTSGDVISVDLHAFRDGDVHVALLRLAGDVAEPAPPRPEVARPAVTCEPASDVAFRGYVDLALSRMAEPTPDALALRLRRLYPHARVVVAEAVAGSAEEVADARWTVRREADAGASSDLEWWVDPGLPRVRYDRNALILEANDAARGLLGDQLVGHHWQEFVTPGSTDEVAAMLTILAEVGRAESRFRMPRADGSLLEFDSWTEVDGDGFTTVMRPRG